MPPTPDPVAITLGALESGATYERLRAVAWIRDQASRLPQHKQLAISHIADELERLSHHVTAET